MKRKLVKIVFKLIITISVLFYLFFAPITFLPYLSSENFINKQDETVFRVIEIWNIDTFEGGSVSRSRFLEKRVIEFEKLHNGTFFIVKNMTEEQALSNIKEGNLPSIFSYGTDFGKNIEKIVSPLKVNGVRNDLLKSGKKDGEQLAIPYILGGYSIISRDLLNEDNKKDTTINVNKIDKKVNEILLNFGFKEYVKNDISSFELYDKYVKEKFTTFLGTQRDVYRCLNRQNNGGFASNFIFIEGYSDLIQYLSVVKSGDENICKELVNFLVSYEIQEKLVNINMFNVLGEEFYNESVYTDFEKTLNKSLVCRSVF